jgi:glycosyltransferase involved in cell wall biosynthesis
MERTAGTDAPEWHIVTCEYAPTLGGISDYTLTVASALAAAGHRVHVWCPEADRPPPPCAGVTIHPELGCFDRRSLRRVGRMLDRLPAPRRLFVQWVPHGFGYRSLNLPFAVWVAGRAWLRGDEIHLMIHEPYMRFSRNLLHSGMSLVHRLMLLVAGSGAEWTWLSTPAWAPFARPYLPRRRPMQWLPVPVPALARADARDAAAVRAQLVPGGGPVVGHFSSHSRILTPVLAPAIDWILQHSRATVVLIGRDGERLRSQIVSARPRFADRIRATGDLDRPALARHFQACDVMLQPYPDGISARRTSTLTLLAHGCPVVTNRGELTESLWSEDDVALAPEPDPSLIGAAVVDLLHDARRRAELGERGLGLYNRLFDVRHAVFALQQASGVPLPSLPQPAVAVTPMKAITDARSG